MNYLFILLVTVLILIILLTVLFADSKTSNNIHRKGNILTIWHPLKKDVINLETDLKSWNIQHVRVLWWGRLYSVNLELSSGKWKKVFSRSLTGKIERLTSYLEKSAKEKKTDSLY